jgi:T4 RnlA family RNA ligase
MNYEFPHITNISDVLPAIEGRDEFVVAVKEGYTVINYNVMMADTFDCNIRRECRGIIFDTATGEIIRRPFHKFFNVNEREETQDHAVDMSRDYAILEKLDGSMIAPFIVNGEMIWGTKMGATDVAQPVEEFVKNNPQYDEFRYLIGSGFTPIFEWCSRKQRIVLDYREDQLVLTAIRDIKTGGYAPYDRLVSLAKSYGVPVIRQWDFAMVEQWHNTVQRGNKTMSSFVNFVRDLEDLEGFVVRFDDGHMLKLKCDWYVQIHKAKEKILQDRNIVELILDNNLDDVKAHLPQEDRDRLTQFESDFNKAVTDTVAYIVQILYYIDKAGVDRKSYAINHAPNVNGYVRPIVFKNFDTPFDMNLAIKILDDVRNTIRNNLTKTVKYEEIRDVWFKGVKYNES